MATPTRPPRGEVAVTSTAVNRHVRSMLMHLRGSNIHRDYGSLAEALHELGMWDFVFNYAEVLAYNNAFAVRDAAVINKYTFGEVAE